LALGRTFAYTEALQLKYRILETKDGGGRHLENKKNCDISATV